MLDAFLHGIGGKPKALLKTADSAEMRTKGADIEPHGLEKPRYDISDMGQPFLKGDRANGKPVFVGTEPVGQHEEAGKPVHERRGIRKRKALRILLEGQRENPTGPRDELPNGGKGIPFRTGRPSGKGSPAVFVLPAELYRSPVMGQDRIKITERCLIVRKPILKFGRQSFKPPIEERRFTDFKIEDRGHRPDVSNLPFEGRINLALKVEVGLSHVVQRCQHRQSIEVHRPERSSCRPLKSATKSRKFHERPQHVSHIQTVGRKRKAANFLGIIRVGLELPPKDAGTINFIIWWGSISRRRFSRWHVRFLLLILN
nr:hypothetical protein [Hydrogenibacillus sp. N12]